MLLVDGDEGDCAFVILAPRYARKPAEDGGVVYGVAEASALVDDVVHIAFGSVNDSNVVVSRGVSDSVHDVSPIGYGPVVDG